MILELLDKTLLYPGAFHITVDSSILEGESYEAFPSSHWQICALNGRNNPSKVISASPGKNVAICSNCVPLADIVLPRRFLSSSAVILCPTFSPVFFITSGAITVGN